MYADVNVNANTNTCKADTNANAGPVSVTSESTIVCGPTSYDSSLISEAVTSSPTAAQRYDWVWTNQIEWYRNVSETLKRKAAGRDIPAMVRTVHVWLQCCSAAYLSCAATHASRLPPTTNSDHDHDYDHNRDHAR